MKVALVHDFLNNFGGAERVLKDLSDIFPDAPIYCLLYDANKLPQFKDKEVIQSSLSKYPGFIKKRDVFLRPRAPKAIEEFDLSKFDVVISNTNSFCKGVITPPSTLHISYIHSPTRYLWDYKDEYLEEHNVRGLKRYFLEKLFLGLRIWDYEAAQRPDYIIANSKNVAQRIKKYYRRKSHVIYPGTDLDKFELGEKKEDFYLIVSRLSKYKKVDLAIRACNKLKKKLIIIGEGSDREYLKNIAGHSVEFKGFLPDKEVRKYYQKAKAFLFPAEEDFGLTPVEAMASGTSVIAYKKGGLLETVSEGLSGIFFKKQTVTGLCQAIEQFEKTKDEFIPHRIRESVQKFGIINFRKEFKSFISDKYKGFKNK
ncbi:MAG: glycosyltransferase [Candidatus Berkelbacteria bacterium]|nr:glycosyltransferase [Candidatus Berkelbacteria bacterium]